mmetsp:Transcript_17491/g.44036  ORF Transcript_17491/g.44036 Transcript_17491/m.44036 type:complete len:618 (+) Transcript_17491:2319-4172(+)
MYSTGSTGGTSAPAALLRLGHVGLGLGPQERAVVVQRLDAQDVLGGRLEPRHLEPPLLALVHVLDHARCGGDHELVALDALRVLGGRHPGQLQAVDTRHALVRQLQPLAQPQVALARVAQPLNVLRQRKLRHHELPQPLVHGGLEREQLVAVERGVQRARAHPGQRARVRALVQALPARRVQVEHLHIAQALAAALRGAPAHDEVLGHDGGGVVLARLGRRAHVHGQRRPAQLLQLQEVDVVERALTVAAAKQVQPPPVLGRVERRASPRRGRVAKAGDVRPVERVLVVDPQVVEQLAVAARAAKHKHLFADRARGVAVARRRPLRALDLRHHPLHGVGVEHADLGARLLAAQPRKHEHLGAPYHGGGVRVHRRQRARRARPVPLHRLQVEHRHLAAHAVVRGRRGARQPAVQHQQLAARQRAQPVGLAVERHLPPQPRVARLHQPRLVKQDLELRGRARLERQLLDLAARLGQLRVALLHPPLERLELVALLLNQVVLLAHRVLQVLLVLQQRGRVLQLLRLRRVHLAQAAHLLRQPTQVRLQPLHLHLHLPQLDLLRLDLLLPVLQDVGIILSGVPKTRPVRVNLCFEPVVLRSQLPELVPKERLLNLHVIFSTF